MFKPVFRAIFERQPSSRLPNHAYVGNAKETLTFYIIHARVMTDANYAAAKVAKLHDRIITIFLLVFSFVITVAPTTQLFQGLLPWFGSIVTIFGALMVSLAAVQYALDFEGRASAHRAAAAEFSRLRREMELSAACSTDDQALRRALADHLGSLSLCSSLAPMVPHRLVRHYYALYLPEKRSQRSTVLPLEGRTG